MLIINYNIIQVTTLITLAEDSNTHWRYSIIALRILRTLIKREEPLSKKHMDYFLRMTHDSHPSLVSLRKVVHELDTDVLFSAT